mmetsp:Transcript_14757/g.32610  ORF Transcript_14757/g.32610 Transcript_14757/m.32610 type:complete len:232 (-) Transcript_14757:2033-2728(-)
MTRKHIKPSLRFFTHTKRNNAVSRRFLMKFLHFFQTTPTFSKNSPFFYQMPFRHKLKHSSKKLQRHQKHGNVPLLPRRLRQHAMHKTKQRPEPPSLLQLLQHLCLYPFLLHHNHQLPAAALQNRCAGLPCPPSLFPTHRPPQLPHDVLLLRLFLLPRSPLVPRLGGLRQENGTLLKKQNMDLFPFGLWDRPRRDWLLRNVPGLLGGLNPFPNDVSPRLWQNRTFLIVSDVI